MGAQLLEVIDEGDPAEAWRWDALCAQTDPEAFFPEKGGSTRDAKKVCTRCEVQTECLIYALRNDEKFGIWGGMSQRERAKLMKQGVTVEALEQTLAVASPKPSPPPFKPADLVRPVAIAEEQSEAVSARVASPQPPAAPRPPKWSVKRVWVAVSPEGEMFGPFESQSAAMAHVGEQLAPAAPDEPTKRTMRPRRAWTDDEVQSVRDLHADGLSDGAIGKAIDRAQPQVSLKRRELGLPVNERKKTSAA